MEVAVVNIQGKETGRKVTLSEAVFGIEPNNHTIYLDIKQYLANQRQGTHKSKERNEVAGSTRKIKKQKGTGTARAGSVKSPVFVGRGRDRKSTLNSSHHRISYAVFCLKKKNRQQYRYKSKHL